MSHIGPPKSSTTISVSPASGASQEKLLPPSPKRRFCSTAWLWETFSLLVSAGCITAVLVLLLVYNNKPIPTWRFITLNTAISILAVVAKSALLVTVAEAISQNKWFWFWTPEKARPVADFQSFDSASRGPWGSTVLLLQPRTWCLVTVGAFVTSAALGMEPSLQQIQTYAVRTVTVGEGFISRVTNYTDIELDASDTGNPMLGISAKGAVYSGLFSSSSSNIPTGLSATCPTGNCTWPAYSTLEVCSVCENMTAQLISYDSGTYGNSWKLGNSNFPEQRSGPAPLEGNAVNSWHDSMTLSSGKNTNWTTFANMGPTPLLATTTLFYPPNSEATKIRPNAFQCMLYFCVNTYTANMRNGVVNQTLVTTWPNTSSPPSVDKTFNSTSDCIGLYAHNPVIAADSCQNWNSSIWTLHPGEHQAQPGKTYSINQFTFTQLSWFLIQKLTGGISNDPDWAVLVDDVSQVFYDAMTGNQQRISRGGEWGKAMPGPGPLFARLAKSLTQHVLTRSEEKAAGTAQTAETLVRGRWGWAVLPISLVGLTAVFLGATAVMSARRDVPVWKSSAMPGLVHGLDEGTCSAMGGFKPEGLGRMERRARTFWVAVSDEGGTVRLRQQRKVVL